MTDLRGANMQAKEHADRMKAATAEIAELTRERDDAREVVKFFQTHLLHDYQHAHDEHCVKPKPGGSIIEWAAAELAAMRAKLEEPK